MSAVAVGVLSSFDSGGIERHLLEVMTCSSGLLRFHTLATNQVLSVGHSRLNHQLYD